MNEITNYDKAVEIIKTAILQSQYDAARSVNEKAADALLRYREIHLYKFQKRLLGEGSH